ncbi:MAG: DUF3857 domain-containing protein [Candidatus Omnitrophica bacterium]|nr:DUF3857 domain-containing protein [Candidatus Omnitrophota bacterium]
MFITAIANNKKIISFFLACIILAGCNQRVELGQAQNYAAQSQAQYQRAVSLYKDLISKGGDLERLSFELGQLYYRQGDFTKAIEQLRNTSNSQAKKMLAISYYRLGDFTDALEAFDKEENKDDESLYYHGLTCEKMNLFDQALEAYKKIKSKEFSSLAAERINIIERQVSSINIRSLSPATYQIISRSPAQELYPQAGALILSCDEKIEILPNNTQVSTLHYIVKILNERGKEDFAESHIGYDSTYEKIELEYARSIRPDGIVVEVGKRHIRDVSKYLNFPLYSNARAYIISFPEITEGSVIEYKIKIYRSQLINKKDFVLGYTLQTREPVIMANFSLTIPRGKNVYIKTINGEYNNFGARLLPSVEKKDKELIYSWQFKDLPQIMPEPSMPPESQINPTIILSTFKSWQEIYNWWWKLARDKIKAGPAIKDKVRELTNNKDSQEAKARAIYNFCAQKIRYVAVEYGQAGYEPHQAEDTFRNKYGDCKDQAILLVTMLKEAGFSAWPVLIATKEYYDLVEDFPAVLFNHCIAALSFRDQTIFLDPTAQTCPFGDLPVDDQARKILLFQETGYKIQETPSYSARHNLISQHLRIIVSPEESVSGEKVTSTYGMYDQAQRFWLLYTPPQLIEEALKEKIQEFSIGARLGSYEIKNMDNLGETITLKYSFSGPEYFTAAGSLRIMPQLVSLDTGLVAKEERRYPIDLTPLDTKETIFEIEIPANFAIKYIPENLNIDSQWVNFKVEYSRNANKIILGQKTELKKTLIPREDYAAFKSFYEELAKKIKQRIILERID